MVDLLEQRATIKFCFLLGKNPAETAQMLQIAYRKNALGKTQVYEWHSRFRKGEVSLDDHPRTGRPLTTRTDDNIEKVRRLVSEDNERTISEISRMSGVSWSGCQRILRKELGLTKIGAKFVPQPLTADPQDRDDEEEVSTDDTSLDAMEEDPSLFVKQEIWDESSAAPVEAILPDDPNQHQLMRSAAHQAEFLDSVKADLSDPTDLMMLSHARRIRGFSRKRQALLGVKIAQLVMEAELEDIAEAETPSTSALA